jgi:succinyl-CoA synthetase beta subunit
MCIAYLENCHTIVEIEINPLFVYSEKICAVDALVHMAAEG